MYFFIQSDLLKQHLNILYFLTNIIADFYVAPPTKSHILQQKNFSKLESKNIYTSDPSC